MLSPSDIRNKRFEKGMSGYKTEEVHTFLNELADTLADLSEENEDLHRKLEILAEKLEQYREDEDSLRSALIGAQKLGDSVVRDSKRKAEAIIAQATRKGEEMLEEARIGINKEAMALNRMQVEVARFKEQILSIYRHHIELIQQIPGDDDVFVKAGAEKGAVEIKAEPQTPAEDEQKFSFQAPEEQQDVTLSFESVPQPQSEDSAEDSEDDFPKRKSKFGTLRFGEAYDLTRKD